MCDAEMVAFMELVLPLSESNPFKVGSQLQIFACREHDDITGTIYSDYTPFVTASRSLELPDDYWNITDGHYLLRLLPPTEATVASRHESRLLPRWLRATEMRDQDPDPFKLPDTLQLYGEPNWIQEPEPHNCSCGAPMKLLLQIPDGYAFPMADGAPEQPNSFSATDYCIFLGNQICLFACSSQCHSHALWPVLQS